MPDQNPVLIITGPPGSGKTFVADKLARYLTGNPLSGPPNNGRLDFVQFHQSYGYEDFVEGIRPNTKPATGQIEYHTTRLPIPCQSIG